MKKLLVVTSLFLLFSLISSLSNKTYAASTDINFSSGSSGTVNSFNSS